MRFGQLEAKIHLDSCRAQEKSVLTAIRTFPEIVLAIMFIKTVGPGSFAGVLAVSVHSIGMLAKLYSEAIENMDQGPSESVCECWRKSLGGFRICDFTAVDSRILSFTLYRFELAVRSASILGIVGAGGIGTPMILLSMHDLGVVWASFCLVLF